MRLEDGDPVHPSGAEVKLIKILQPNVRKVTIKSRISLVGSVLHSVRTRTRTAFQVYSDCVLAQTC